MQIGHATRIQTKIKKKK